MSAEKTIDRRKWLGPAIKLLVSGFAVFFLWRHAGDLRGVATVSRIDGWWIWAAWILLGLSIAVGTARWGELLKIQALPQSFLSLLRCTLIGWFFNAFLLGATGGDLVRVAYAVKLAPNHRSAAAISVVADRSVGLLSMVFCVALGAPIFLGKLQNAWLTQVAWLSLGTLTASILVFVGALFTARNKITRMFVGNRLAGSRKLVRFIPLAKTVDCYLRKPAMVARSFALGVGSTLVTVAAGWCTAHALGIRPSFMEMTVILPAILLVASIPISVGGLGVREGAAALLFNVFHIEGASGTSAGIFFSLVWFALNIIWSVFGGVLYLSDSSSGPR